MKRDDVKKTPGKKTTFITIRVTPQMHKWIKTNQLSSTKIFEQACKELKYEGIK